MREMPSIHELRNAAQSERRDFMYRFMNSLAFYPAKILVPFSITPNQVTVLWILGQFASALLLLTGNRAYMIASLLLFQAFFVIDCTDGIIARYKKKFSLNGIYLDHLGHYLADPFLLGCYTYAVFRIYQNPWYMVIGGIAILAFLTNKAITLNPAWYPLHQRELIVQSAQKSLIKNQRSLLYHLFALFRLEYFCNIMFWGTVIGFPQYTLALYSLFFSLELARKIMSQFRINQKFDQEERTDSKTLQK